MRILKIDSLPKSTTWIDRDEIMLHACFQILQDCVDKENVDADGDYNSIKESIDEIRFLYNWWKKRKNNDDLDCDKDDDEMLIRLMKIRGGLWT